MQETFFVRTEVFSSSNFELSILGEAYGRTNGFSS